MNWHRPENYQNFLGKNSDHILQMIKSEKILLEIDVCFIFDDLAFQIYAKLRLFLFF